MPVITTPSATSGATVIEYPEVGEVIWGDAEGVTCRRWNWRQGRRTQLTDHTSTALFILDALSPMTDEQLTAAADDLTFHLTRLGANVTVAYRLITA
jgi:DNA/RNA-binding domain of Phe-tRNA-synthetase-like protein